MLPFTLYRLVETGRDRLRRAWDLALVAAGLGLVLLAGFRSAWIAAAIVFLLAALVLPRGRGMLWLLLGAIG